MEQAKAYKNLWNIEKRVYSIGDFVVPRPPTTKMVMYYFVGLVLVVFIKYLLGLHITDDLIITFIVLPVGFAFLIDRIKLDGKRIDRFLFTMIHFFLSPKKYYGYKVLGKQQKYSMDSKIFCLETRSGGEEI